MKLRNKKTGKIISSKELLTDEFIIDLFSKDFNYFNSKLDKIQEDWEDYEEHVKNDDKVFIDRIGDRINKFKKEFVEKDLTITNNKIELFNTICDIELDIKFYLVNGSDYAS